MERGTVCEAICPRCYRSRLQYFGAIEELDCPHVFQCTDTDCKVIILCAGTDPTAYEWRRPGHTELYPITEFIETGEYTARSQPITIDPTFLRRYCRDRKVVTADYLVGQLLWVTNYWLSDGISFEKQDCRWLVFCKGTVIAVIDKASLSVAENIPLSYDMKPVSDFSLKDNYELVTIVGLPQAISDIERLADTMLTSYREISHRLGRTQPTPQSD